MSPRTPLLDAHRIVVKLGTGVITGEDGGFAMGRLYALIEQMAKLHHEGRELILVSSGAVGMGVRELDLTERPTSLGLRQACLIKFPRCLVFLDTAPLPRLLERLELPGMLSGRFLELKTRLMQLAQLAVP